MIQIAIYAYPMFCLDARVIFFVFFFIMCYHANILEHLPNSIFEFCSNFAVYTIIRYLFLDLCFYKKKTVHIDELQDCCETG